MLVMHVQHLLFSRCRQHHEPVRAWGDRKLNAIGCAHIPLKYRAMCRGSMNCKIAAGIKGHKTLALMFRLNETNGTITRVKIAHPGQIIVSVLITRREPLGDDPIGISYQQ